MKRAVSLFLSAVLLLGLLSACGNSEQSAPPVWNRTVSELAELAFEYSGRENQDGLEAVNAEMDLDWIAAYLENAYGLQEPWEDVAVIRASGASAFEIAVLRMENEDAAARAVSVLEGYLDTREGDFAGYAPEEADMVRSGKTAQTGPYAALFICPDPDGAAEAVRAAALTGTQTTHLGTPSPTVEPITGAKELRDLLAETQGMSASTMLDNGDPDALDAYIREAYGLEPDQWEECAIALDETSAAEIAVFRFSSSKAGESKTEIRDGEFVISPASDDGWERINTVSNKLDDYLNRREAQFDSGSEQAKMLHQAISITSMGEYALLLACPDSVDMAGVFANASGMMGYGWSSRYRYLDTDPSFPDRCAFTAPNVDDMSLYDTSAIRAAWASGDSAGLSKKDREIYDAAQKVLKKLVKSGMSDYEKEVAVYNWIVNSVDYDWTHQDRMKDTPRESFEPYGGLVNHTAVCLGYATTFQLLMDLAGVECITVPGAAFSSQEDHGWNMVRINGEWYCLDATWDANYREHGGSGRQRDWSYFNVTSDEMADSDHQWDYANTPEATAEDRGRG